MKGVDRALIASALLGLTLAACQAPPPEPAPEPEPEPIVEDAPPPEPPPPPPPKPEASDLLGLEPKTVQSLLGAPSFVRRDGHVQLMQFAAAGCRMDVVFYEDSPGAPFEASHVEARDPAGEPLPADDCLREILDGNDWPAAFRASLDTAEDEPR